MISTLRKIKNKLRSLTCGVQGQTIIQAIERYKRNTGKQFNIRKPNDINQKLIWLHMNWQNPLIVQCADKLAVKDYLQSTGLEHLSVPTISIYENAENINFDALPNQFVLKCNHGCGYNIICNSKAGLNVEETISTLNKWKNEVYGRDSFELHYSQIVPRIYAEEYLDFGKPEEVIDIKLQCIGGKPFCFLICHNRNLVTHTVELGSYNLEWERVDYLHKESSITIEKPEQINDILEVADILAKPFPFVRLDFYILNEKLYLGEMTFTPAGNIMTYYKDEVLLEMGNNLTLPPKIKKKIWFP